LSEQAHAGRLIRCYPIRDDAVPAQITYQFIRLRLMLGFGRGEDFDAAAKLGKKRQRKAYSPRSLPTSVPRDERTAE
jgi:hypothetical protein